MALRVIVLIQARFAAGSTVRLSASIRSRALSSAGVNVERK
jgi:hypothetical protein